MPHATTSIKSFSISRSLPFFRTLQKGAVEMEGAKHHMPRLSLERPLVQGEMGGKMR